MERMNYIPSFELHNLNTLIVGGGNVGLKSCLLLKSSPNAIVEVVAPRFYPIRNFGGKPWISKTHVQSSIAGCFVNATWSLLVPMI
jgi:siroheme synthase (precorrin-2 oxidase/ferrochelatase)